MYIHPIVPITLNKIEWSAFFKFEFAVTTVLQYIIYCSMLIYVCKYGIDTSQFTRACLLFRTSLFSVLFCAEDSFESWSWRKRAFWKEFRERCFLFLVTICDISWIRKNRPKLDIFSPICLQVSLYSNLQHFANESDDQRSKIKICVHFIYH